LEGGEEVRGGLDEGPGGGIDVAGREEMVGIMTP